MKENKIMKMISRRDFLKASAVVGATAAMTACGGSASSTAAAPCGRDLRHLARHAALGIADVCCHRGIL